MAFHLAVKSCVDRILLFTNGEFIGEMEKVYDVEHRIFNGTVPEGVHQLTAVHLCYALGEVRMPAKEVFSRPIKERPYDTNIDVMANAISINFFNPTETDGDIASAKFCIVTVPEQLRLGLGLPELIFLEHGEFTAKMTPEQIQNMHRRGFNPDANGHFLKKIEHLWAKCAESAAELSQVPLTISAYAHTIIKTINI